MVATEIADALRLARVMEIIRDRTGRGAVGELTGLRVLDLASRIGVFSERLADAGATVVGIEGRQVNLDQVPHPRRATYVKSDVRMVDFESHFDVTLCLGLLYHLPAADALELMRSLARITDDFMVLDTHIALETTATAVILDEGKSYEGAIYSEGDATAPWSAMRNVESFWFTDGSLIRMLLDADWQTIVPLLTPAYPDEPLDRRWYVVSR